MNPTMLVHIITTRVEQKPETRVADLHAWSIGPGKRAAIVAIETAAPRPLDEYRASLPSDGELTHVTIEVNAC